MYIRAKLWWNIMPLICQSWCQGLWHGPVHKRANHVPKKKPFRIAIRFVIGIVIWTMFVHKHCKCRAVPITNRICALRGNILFLLRSPRWLTQAWASVRISKISKMRTHESRSERALHSHVLRSESGFLRESRSKNASCFRVSNAFQKPDLKKLCIHKG